MMQMILYKEIIIRSYMLESDLQLAYISISKKVNGYICKNISVYEK